MDDAYDSVEVSLESKRPFGRAILNYGRTPNYRPLDSSWDDPEVLSVITDVFWSMTPEQDTTRGLSSMCRDCYEDYADPGELLCPMCHFDHMRKGLAG